MSSVARIAFGAPFRAAEIIARPIRSVVDMHIRVEKALAEHALSDHTGRAEEDHSHAGRIQSSLGNADR